MDKHNENINQCKNIFVTWTWVISILVLLLMSISGMTYTLGSKVKEVGYSIKEDSMRISSLEEKVTELQKNNLSKLDSILIILTKDAGKKHGKNKPY